MRNVEAAGEITRMADLAESPPDDHRSEPRQAASAVSLDRTGESGEPWGELSPCLDEEGYGHGV